MKNEKTAHGQPVEPSMSEVDKELRRIEAGLHDKSTPPAIYCQLYAAQQALAWIINPAIAQSPFAVISNGLVQPLTHTPAN
jgi:hypothetical protein